MINAQLDLYILSFYPNQIHVLIDKNTNTIPCCEITTKYPIDYQLYHLLKIYSNDILEKYANFRFINLEIVNEKLVISYLITVGSTAGVKSDTQGKYVSLETLLNEHTHKTIQKIKNII